MKKLFLLAIVAGSYLTAQQFISPVSQSTIGMSKYVNAYAKDGTKVTGKVGSAVLSKGIKSLTVKKEDGSKVKYKAAQLDKLEFKASGLMKMSATESSSIVGAVKKDYSEIINREYVIFEFATIKGKPFMLQLLNPGFDENYKVYQDPNAKETSGIGGITGGNAKSYYVCKKGQTEAIFVKKSKYKKDLLDLFDGCDKMKEILAGDDVNPKFKNFPIHIAIYNENCNE